MGCVTFVQDVYHIHAVSYVQPAITLFRAHLFGVHSICGLHVGKCALLPLHNFENIRNA